jgi:hypothetical protein
MSDDYDSTNLNVSESADKIRLETKVKRGEGTRDQDEVKVKIKGNNPEDAAATLAETLDALDEHGVVKTLRDTQAGGGE